MHIHDYERYVCPACVGDAALKAFIESEAENEECSFCGATSEEAIAAPLDELISYIQSCISKEYDDPANCMGYCSQEGGYLGETFNSHEILYEIDLELPNDDGSLFSAISQGLSDQLWCRRNPYGMSRNETLSYSWETFCEIIKHQRRFFFQDESRDRSLLTPAEVLGTIFEFAENIGVVKTLSRDGIKLFRARLQRPGETFENVLQLGPPPPDAAKQNRMSPAGIVMMYVSEDAATALAETIDREGIYVVGEFGIERDAIILDLAELPETPSIFYEVPDAMEYDPRQHLIFLNEIADEISRPIARDDRVHVEYIPTQVVTEFLRTVVTWNGNRIDGIRYRSSRRSDGSSLVLFADQTNLVIPENLRDGSYGYYRDHWIRLVSKQVYEITNLNFDYDVRPVWEQSGSVAPE
jgi:HEPN/RES N-terminal domain 1/RES domain